ncbi:MAG: uroporphyrinogen decarboxylase [Gammaproteobacteria bacterium]|nr:uroporphyrinogen decarboxylase [Gammaproteobacteria bacterium]TVQ45963.1 MAG: uroporphyrinogen decarboxylase [Gammaproteobacteria bacterium]
MSPLKNDLLLRALLREPVERTPVWMMRQAGRYLPEYRALRAEAGDFLTLCSTPDLACEITVQPIRRFPLDAAILFSDILTVPHAMGLGLYFAEGEGPRFRHPVRSAADVVKLGVPDVEDDLGYVTEAVRRVRRELDGRVPLIGFAGSPWTVATYCVEGGGSKNHARIKGMLYGDPGTLHRLLELLARATVDYLNAQVAAGAQAVMVFDTWGGLLSPAAYREFSLQYMSRIVEGLDREAEGRRVPVILFTKGAGARLTEMADAGCDALGVDWTTDLAEARRLTADRVALQGNLDPSVLYAPPARIAEEVGRVLSSYGRGPGHVFNLGHGIHPDIDPEHVAAMLAAVHARSPAFHA